jgi:hypothetical protein
MSYIEILCLLKTSRDRQIFFAVMSHVIEGLSLEALTH